MKTSFHNYLFYTTKINFCNIKNIMEINFHNVLEHSCTSFVKSAEKQGYNCKDERDEEYFENKKTQKCIEM